MYLEHANSLLRGASFGQRSATHKRRATGRVLLVMAMLAGVQTGQHALAFGAQGHAFSGAVADRLLNPRAASQVARLLGTTLKVAATWADCVKDVAPGPAGFMYVPDPRYQHSCQPFETPAGVARMIDYVERNWSQCERDTYASACHRDYHFTDVAFQHEHYDRMFIGTSDHDVVSALNAAIAVLRGLPAQAPFSIRDMQEALLLLAHFVGDVHQPLHVGALYLDAHGQPVDPDLNGPPLDTRTSTRGGNSIGLRDGRSDTGSGSSASNLHAEWDAVPADIQPSQVGRGTLAVARRVTTNPNDLRTWPTAWASETLLVSHAAFAGLSFRPDPDKPGRWTARFTDEAAYVEMKTGLQERQLIKAGARLAQVLNALWP